MIHGLPVAGKQTKCPSCGSDVPLGADACPRCGVNPYQLRATKQRRNRKIGLIIAVVLVVALIAYQLSIPIIKDLSRTESQRRIVTASDLGDGWHSSDPRANDEFYRQPVEGDSSYVRLIHTNSSSFVDVDCILAIYADRGVANIAYNISISYESLSNMTAEDPDLGDRSVVYSSAQEGHQGWLRVLVIIQDRYVVYIHAVQRLSSAISVDLPLLVSIGETQLNKLS